MNNNMVIFQNDYLRISLYTPRLIRTECASFTDLPTQTVINRDFEKVEYKISEDSRYVTVTTDRAVFKVKKKSGDVTYASFDSHVYTKKFGKRPLPGTARTLDMANGSVKLSDGITSRYGTGVIDDSKSLIVKPDGTIGKRERCSDRYWFAYGHDYLEQMRDFFKLTGEVPLIPKYALGNWWSRYKAYTQEEYRDLMKRFIERKLPITVATIDMDWHWTDVIARFGEDAKSEKPRCAEEWIYYLFMQGWTGYSWNTELFPDHKELLEWLHSNGFKVTLNIHPSQGVRFFEDRYAEMCKALGTDPEKREIISFDVTDPEFMKAYFEVLHHPLEDEGVDFWWIDWQQGKKTNIPGLDPLWALNHYHYLDSAKGGKRPLILSRYAGLGSHRYPLGFSGDTICTWRSLDFQPYFTASAANAGYTWWSHDIGGHMKGRQDDEMYLRWLQLGVFSPINRLHSSNSDFMGKEPWKRSYAVSRISEEFLRLRHRLIPYLYTANYRTHKYGEPICMPMYYRYDCDDAYRAKNQYIFGGTLVVCPITKPMEKRLNLSYADVWLPNGFWTDIFTGRRYAGGRWVRMYRDLDCIPVLAPEGAIVPMYKNRESNDLSLDQPLEINVYRGNGEYTLYEDDGETNEYVSGKYVTTKFKVEYGNSKLKLTIIPNNAEKLFDNERKMHIKFCDLNIDETVVSVGNEPVTIELDGVYPKRLESKEEMRSALLTRVQGSNVLKSISYKKRLPGLVKKALSELDSIVCTEE